MRNFRLLFLNVLVFVAMAITASAQCGKLAFNPFTQQMDCVGLASSSATVSSVVIQGTANQIGVAGTCTITTSGTCTVSLPANTIVPGVNGGTLQQAGSGLLSGTYTSGITATGTIDQTCSLTAFNNGNVAGTATVALTGTNTIAGGTALVITAAGSGNTSASTSATAGNGTATCSGTATVATVLTGFATTLTTTATTNSTLPAGTHSLAAIDSVQGGGYIYVTDSSSSTTTYTGCPTPSVGLTAGMQVHFVPANANTGASTLNLCTTSAVAITANNTTHSALVADDLLASGVYTLEYDGTRWLKINGPDGAWTAISYSNSWTDVGGAYQVGQYRKDRNGIVCLRGALKSGTTTFGTTIMTMPAGYRPTATNALSIMTQMSSGITFQPQQLDVQSGGNVLLQTQGSPTASGQNQLAGTCWSVY